MGSSLNLGVQAASRPGSGSIRPLSGISSGSGHLAGPGQRPGSGISHGSGHLAESGISSGSGYLAGSGISSGSGYLAGSYPGGSGRPPLARIGSKASQVIEGNKVLRYIFLKIFLCLTISQYISSYIFMCTLSICIYLFRKAPAEVDPVTSGMQTKTEARCHS